MATSTDSKPSPASSQPLSTSAAPTQAPSNVADSRYTFDDAKLEELRKQSPWKNDPKYFKQVSVSPTAIVKMVRMLILLLYVVYLDFIVGLNSLCDALYYYTI